LERGSALPALRRPRAAALAAWRPLDARPPRAPSFLQLPPLPAQHGVLEFNTKIGGPDFYSMWLSISRWHVFLSLIAMLFWWAVITFDAKIFVLQDG